MAQTLPKLIHFPSIGAARNVFPHLKSATQFVGMEQADPTGRKTRKAIYDTSRPLPILTFRGTVKLHGSNCAIVQTRLANGEKSLHFQSRSRRVSREDDYEDFAKHMDQQQELLNKMFQNIFLTRSKLKAKQVKPEDVEAIAIFGEWCGGNIQKNMGISRLPKMFVIFAVKFDYRTSLLRRKEEDRHEWIDLSHLQHLHYKGAGIFNIFQFDKYEVTIDLECEKSKVEGQLMMEQLTLGVQQECPVAKKFGVKGKVVNGEGIVWQVVKAVPSSDGGAALDLKRFTGSKCWMKTRDIKPGSLPSPPWLPAEEKPANQIAQMQPVVGVVEVTNPTAKQGNPAPSIVKRQPVAAEGSIAKKQETHLSPCAPPKSAAPPIIQRQPTNGIHQDIRKANATASITNGPKTPPVTPPKPQTIPIGELLQLLLPQWRMEQGMQFLERELGFPKDIKCVGAFIDWVAKDILKEEYDRIEGSGIAKNELMVVVSEKAMKWYLGQMEEEWWNSKDDWKVGAEATKETQFNAW